MALKLVPFVLMVCCKHNLLPDVLWASCFQKHTRHQSTTNPFKAGVLWKGRLPLHLHWHCLAVAAKHAARRVTQVYVHHGWGGFMAFEAEYRGIAKYPVFASPYAMVYNTSLVLTDTTAR